MVIGAEVPISLWTAVTATTIYLLVRFGHIYASTFIFALLIGYLHSIFSLLHLYKQYLGLPDKTTMDIFLSDEYTFSMICFATIVGIFVATVLLERDSIRIVFGIFLFLSISLIIILRKFGCFLIPEENIVHLESAPETKTSLFFVSKRYFSTICPGGDNFAKFCVLLEYLCIYIPVTALFCKMINKSSTYRDWWNLSSKEKCPGCQFDVSLGCSCVLHFLTIIWILRPLIYLLSYCYDSVFIDSNSVPLIAVLSINILMLWYIIQYYTSCAHGRHAKCLEEHSKSDADIKQDEKLVTNI